MAAAAAAVVLELAEGDKEGEVTAAVEPEGGLTPEEEGEMGEAVTPGEPVVGAGDVPLAPALLAVGDDPELVNAAFGPATGEEVLPGEEVAAATAAAASAAEVLLEVAGEAMRAGEAPADAAVPFRNEEAAGDGKVLEDAERGGEAAVAPGDETVAPGDRLLAPGDGTVAPGDG